MKEGVSRELLKGRVSRTQKKGGMGGWEGGLASSSLAKKTAITGRSQVTKSDIPFFKRKPQGK